MSKVETMIFRQKGEATLPLPLSKLDTLLFYEDFKHFRRYMYQAIDKMPRWIKVSEGMLCIKSIKQCLRYLSQISRAFGTNSKIMYIDKFLTEWDVIFDSISFFFEVNGISTHQRNVMLNLRSDLEDKISCYRVELVCKQKRESKRLNAANKMS